MVDYALGKVLILIGFLMLAGEVVIPGFFVGAVGIALMVAGILIEMGINSPELIVLGSILAGLASVVFFYSLSKWMVGKRKIATGAESVVGEIGKVIAVTDEDRCVVKIKGEEWSCHYHGTLKIGEKVKVTGYEGVHLKVERS